MRTYTIYRIKPNTSTITDSVPGESPEDALTRYARDEQRQLHPLVKPGELYLVVCNGVTQISGYASAVLEVVEEPLPPPPLVAREAAL